MGRVLFSDMGSHGLIPGDKLQGPLFPIMYPISDPVEREERQAGRSPLLAFSIRGVARAFGEYVRAH